VGNIVVRNLDDALRRPQETMAADRAAASSTALIPVQPLALEGREYDI
jgi:hypothetical protein